MSDRELTEKLQANPEFQRQSKEYERRLATGTLGEPGGEEELRTILKLVQTPPD